MRSREDAVKSYRSLIKRRIRRLAPDTDNPERRMSTEWEEPGALYAANPNLISISDVSGTAAACTGLNSPALRRHRSWKVLRG